MEANLKPRKMSVHASQVKNKIPQAEEQRHCK